MVAVFQDEVATFPVVAWAEAQVQLVDSPVQVRAEEALLLLPASLHVEVLLLLPLPASLPLPKMTGINPPPEMLLQQRRVEKMATVV